VLKSVSDFPFWRLDFKATLTRNGLDKYLFNMPDPGSSDDMAADAKAKADLLLAVPASLKPEIDRCLTTYDAYALVERRWTLQIGVKAAELSAAFGQLAMRASESADDFVTRAKNLWLMLEQVRVERSEKDLCAAILNGLPASWAAVKFNLQLACPDMEDVEQLRLRLMMYEKTITPTNGGQRQEQEQLLDTPALLGHPGQRQQPFKPPHHQKDTPSFNGKCYNCGKFGHRRAHCKKPPTNQRRPDQHRPFSQDPAAAFCFAAAVPVSKSLVLDSGASRHITNDKGSLINVRQPDKLVVTFGNKSTGEVLAQGDMPVRVENGKGGYNSIVLRNVLYTPQVMCTLMSVPCVTAAGGRVTY
jgi:hypothetical protein